MDKGIGKKFFYVRIAENHVENTQNKANRLVTVLILSIIR